MRADQRLGVVDLVDRLWAVGNSLVDHRTVRVLAHPLTSGHSSRRRSLAFQA